MRFHILQIVFSMFIQVIHMKRFPAKMRATDVGIPNDSYFEFDGGLLTLRKPIAAKDHIMMEYIVQTEAVEYMDIDAFDIILTEKNISLCHTDSTNLKHRQVLKALKAVLSLDVSKGCPIDVQSFRPYQGDFVMYFDYMDNFPIPSCSDLDWLVINLYIPSDPEPFFVTLISIENHAMSPDCLEW